MVKNCPRKSQLQQQQRTGAAVHNMQATIEGPIIQLGRLEAPPLVTNARLFAFTKEEVARTSNDVIGQTLVNFRIARVLFDTVPHTCSSPHHLLVHLIDHRIGWDIGSPLHDCQDKSWCRLIGYG